MDRNVLIQESVALRPFYAQLWLAHALHLAVLDTLKVREESEEEPKDDEDTWQFARVLEEDAFGKSKL